jgi:hypothetical protein
MAVVAAIALAGTPVVAGGASASGLGSAFATLAASASGSQSVAASPATAARAQVIEQYRLSSGAAIVSSDTGSYQSLASGEQIWDSGPSSGNVNDTLQNDLVSCRWALGRTYLVPLGVDRGRRAT